MGKRANIALEPPVPGRHWALFLDIDGTLLDIASRPDAVQVPPGLTATLERVRDKLRGALALVSGRPIPAIDALFAPLVLPCAAEHGAVVRLPDGTIWQPDKSCRVPDSWRQQLEQVTKSWDGVIVDSKGYSIALHYRLAPERQGQVRDLVARMASMSPDFELIPARMAYEIRHRNLHKGTAVARFMGVCPFSGRMPVFVGDDITDEDGMTACRKLGGLGLHVDTFFAGQPACVVKWLASFVDGPGEKRGR